MAITGYEVVEYAVVYQPGYSHVKPGTLTWDAETGTWGYETETVPYNVLSGSEVYTTPLGKKIIWADDINKLVSGGSGYRMTLISEYHVFVPRPRPSNPNPGDTPYPQPEIDPEWENPPDPPIYTQTETFVIADATSEIEV